MSEVSNPPTEIDAERFRVTRTVMIAATQDRVWEAVTRPEHIAKWSSFTPSMDRIAVGGAGAWAFPTIGSMPIAIEAMDPPASITYRWSAPGFAQVDPVLSTVFQFTLTPVAHGTQLTVVETGFERLADPATEMVNHARGWDSGLDSLAACPLEET